MPSDSFFILHWFLGGDFHPPSHFLYIYKILGLTFEKSIEILIVTVAWETVPEICYKLVNTFIGFSIFHGQTVMQCNTVPYISG